MAVMGQSLQQVELQLRMQQKQHEDVMKILVQRLAVAPQDRLLAAAAQFSMSPVSTKMGEELKECISATLDH